VGLIHDKDTARDDVCVYCRRQPVTLTWKPFCSERCKLLDLGNWINGHYQVPGDAASSLPDEGERTDDDV
jgi:endogenous inhibitor of DNA gyrase (YacG/DUF329 family)